MKEAIGKLYQDTITFNKLAGNAPPAPLTDAWWEAMENQAKRVLEEVKETLEAIEDRNVKETLDGVVDISVTALYMPFMTQSKEIDVKGAMAEVAANNLAKIFKYYSDAEATKDWYEGQGTACYIDEVFMNGVTYYAVRRNCDQKILKPKDHRRVELGKYIRNK